MGDIIAQRIEDILRRSATRREAGKAIVKTTIAAAVAGAVATATLGPKVIKKGFEELAKLDEPSPIGKFLNTQDGKAFIITEKPIPVKVEYTSIRNPSTGKTGVVIRREKPYDDAQDMLLHYPEISKNMYAVRVLGAGYAMQNPENNDFGKIDVKYNGENKKGGLWFMISNEKGEPINPFTQKGLDSAIQEKPYYVSARYVSVLHPKQPLKENINPHLASK